MEKQLRRRKCIRLCCCFLLLFACAYLLLITILFVSTQPTAAIIYASFSIQNNIIKQQHPIGRKPVPEPVSEMVPHRNEVPDSDVVFGAQQVEDDEHVNKISAKSDEDYDELMTSSSRNGPIRIDADADESSVQSTKFNVQSPKRLKHVHFNASSFERFLNREKQAFLAASAAENSVFQLHNGRGNQNAQWACIAPRPPMLLHHICVYNHTADEYVSASLAAIHQWEGGILQSIGVILRLFPEAGFIDIGAYIGTHCLYVAALKRKAVCIEPFEDNLALLHHSVVLNNFTKFVKILPSCLSDKEGVYHFRRTPGNPGNSFIDSEVVYSSNKISLDSPAGGALHNCVTLHSVLRSVTFRQALLKVDVEGSEARIFRPPAAGKFFSKLEIPVVFMEWGVLRTKSTKIDRQSTYRFFIDRNYQPCAISKTGLQRIWEENLTAWPWDILWIKADKIGIVSKAFI